MLYKYHSVCSIDLFKLYKNFFLTYFLLFTSNNNMQQLRLLVEGNSLPVKSNNLLVNKYKKKKFKPNY